MVRSRCCRGLEQASLRRGDIVKAIFPGDYGKPRPGVVVQSDRLAGIQSVILCPLTSELTDSAPLRITVAPDLGNGLHQPSQIMADKIGAVPRSKCREVIGSVDADTMRQIDAALALVIGLLD